MTNLYLRFLRLAKALDSSKNSLKEIDATAIKLLNEVAVMHFESNPLTVTQAMELHGIASPATIHRKLDELREAGLIDLVFEGKNRRTKYLIPTKAAHAYFEKMSDSILKAVQS
jgi:DNA-binding MarR family transcriptional regulator